MANEIKDTLKRASISMHTIGHLSKGVYVEIVEHALAGRKFSVEMSVHDCNKMRARMTYHKKGGVMHQHVQNNGRTAIVSFND